ncbi:UNVERIFIED_CONTAM: hypothetical protein K2H54_000163 [Gekko kuhli]
MSSSGGRGFHQLVIRDVVEVRIVFVGCAKLLNRIILILFLAGAILLFMLEVTTVRQSILDQMSANLETANTALGLVLAGHPAQR